ncbi:hypothetical protein AGMMS50276_20340 [Synergistales bacterium]|nr:hypothetical protein AGMMS50276_20340 [Synergistales bacterium]
MKDFKYANSILGVLFFVLGAWCYWESGEYVPWVEMEGQMGAHIFPRLFAGALMFLSALMIFMDVKQFTKATIISFDGIGVVFVIAVLCFAFWYFIPIVGFLSTATLFVCIITAIATRKLRIFDYISVVVVLSFIYFIFANLLKVPLPRGFFI